MAIYNKAIRTSKGKSYDASVNANEFQAQYPCIYISSHDYTAIDVENLEEIDDIIIRADVSDIKKNSDVAVSIYASYTNAGRKTPFELRTIALIAFHPKDGFIIHSIVTASIPDTIPEDDGANLVDETFQFILEEVDANNTLLKGSSNGLITVDIFTQYKNETTIILGQKAELVEPQKYNFVLNPMLTVRNNGPGQEYVCNYTKDQFGRVTINLNIQTVSGGNEMYSTEIATLPEGFRPLENIGFAGVGYTNNASKRAPANFYIYKTGRILLDCYYDYLFAAHGSVGFDLPIK